MAKKKAAKLKVVKELQHPELLEKLLAHVEKLYRDHEKRFIQALEDSDRRKIQLGFDSVLDLSDSAPDVDTSLTFKDRDEEGGMTVTKTFKARIREHMDDPNQEQIPGTDPETLSGKDAAAGGGSDSD